MQRITESLKSFWRDERAAVVTETVMLIPLLIFAYGGMFVLWDAIKTKHITQSAAYTISDMISRQPGDMNLQFFNGLHDMLEFLTYEKHDTEMRISVVSMESPDDGVTEELVLMWSESTDNWCRIGSITNIEDSIPPIALGDRVIVVETNMTYEPLFNLFGLGLEPTEIYNFVVTRPRTKAQIKWDDAPKTAPIC